MKKKRIILDEPTEKFLSNLKVLRQQRGLTQKQLAQELGLLRSIYQRCKRLTTKVASFQ